MSRVDYARQTVSAAVIAKGERIFDGRLVAEGPQTGTFRVKGDHGVYRVTLYSIDEFGVNGDCSCPAYRSCSHIYAAVLLAADRGIDLNQIASDDPFAGIV